MKVGLGPIVCFRCDIFAVEDEHNDYHCPLCGRDDDLEYQWLMSEDRQKRVENNSKLYRFTAGEDVN